MDDGPSIVNHQLKIDNQNGALELAIDDSRSAQSAIINRKSTIKKWREEGAQEFARGTATSLNWRRRG
jgi:hypothetical protein